MSAGDLIGAENYYQHAEAPRRSVRWKLVAIVASFLAFCTEGAILYWQYLRLPEQPTLPDTEEGQSSAPTLPQQGAVEFLTKPFRDLVSSLSLGGMDIVLK
jgi:hypothetical protein